MATRVVRRYADAADSEISRWNRVLFVLNIEFWEYCCSDSNLVTSNLRESAPRVIFGKVRTSEQSISAENTLRTLSRKKTDLSKRFEVHNHNYLFRLLTGTCTIESQAL